MLINNESCNYKKVLCLYRCGGVYYLLFISQTTTIPWYIAHVLQIFIYFKLLMLFFLGAFLVPVFPDVDSVCHSLAVYGVGCRTIHTERTSRGYSQALSSVQRQESSEFHFPDDINYRNEYHLHFVKDMRCSHWHLICSF